MKNTASLRTSLQCMACVSKVENELNELLGQNNWEIDLTNPSKILTIDNSTDKLQDVINIINSKGFDAEVN